MEGQMGELITIQHILRRHTLFAQYKKMTRSKSETRCCQFCCFQLFGFSFSYKRMALEKMVF